MRMELDFVTKLGGCAITNKQCFETLNADMLNNAAGVLGKCYQNGLKFVVVHGAGSFGHYQAREYGVNKGYKNESTSRQNVMMGFCKTRLSVCKLNHEVVTALVDHGVPAVAVSPCCTWTTNEGVLDTDGTAALLQLITDGFVPCLHGDCVHDRSQGCAILSGDVLIQRLCEAFCPNRVVFLTDVTGVYSKPPEQTGATLIRHIVVQQDGTVTTQFDTSTTPACDVTGGIALKVATASEIVRHHNGRVYVVICTGTAYHNVCLTGSLDGEPGTVIEYSKTPQSADI